MLAAITALMLSQATTPKPIGVDELLVKMRAAYQKVRSADMTVVVTLGSPDRHYVMNCSIRYVAPNLIHKVISNAKGTKGLTEMPGFTFISDGKQLLTRGRPGHDGIKAFSTASIQDDGAPVYKEALSFWDFKRQWSGVKGGVASGYKYRTSTQDMDGKSWIGLEERTPDDSEVFHYFIDSKTYMIRRTHYFVPTQNDWALVQDCHITKLVVNGKIDRSIFKIKKS